MRRRILITGATGVLGDALLAVIRGEDITALVRDPKAVLDGVKVLPASLPALPHLDRNWEIIIHAAADTRFTSPKAELWRSNVEATQNLIAFARSCPNLQRFIHISTTCVAGNIGGSIPENFCRSVPTFHNAYEESKWHAEKLFIGSGLPFQIFRIPIVIGDRGLGAIRRPLAIHHALRWISQGLVPFLPAHPDAYLDLISSDYVTDVIREALATTDPASCPIVHISRGAQAPRLVNILDRLIAWLSAHRLEWKKRVFSSPTLMAAEPFAIFRRLIEETGNPIFRSIYQVTDVLASTLIVPKHFATSVASRVPEIAWETLCDRVFDFHLSRVIAQR
jgi:nucleoside-diphosphate-sugar epimerase